MSDGDLHSLATAGHAEMHQNMTQKHAALGCKLHVHTGT